MSTTKPKTRKKAPAPTGLGFPELNPPLLPASVARCREFLQMRKEDSIPDKITTLQAERFEEAKRAQVGTMVASADKKREDPVVELSLKTLLTEIVNPIVDGFIDGPRMEEYGRLIFGESVDFETMEVDTLCVGIDFFRLKSKRLLSTLTNSEEGFASALTTSQVV